MDWWGAALTVQSRARKLILLSGRVVVLNPWFFTAFFGTTAVCILLVAFSQVTWSTSHAIVCRLRLDNGFPGVLCTASVISGTLVLGTLRELLMPVPEPPRTLINCLNIGSQRANKRRENDLESKKHPAHVAKAIMRTPRLIYG